MNDVAIKVQGLGKQYKIATVKKQAYQTLQETIIDAVKAPFRRAKKLMSGDSTGAAELNETFWALRNVSFEVKRGEVIGILGRNGAGKSTLLKILSRITDPTEGRAEIRGRVASLLEVGTGFSLELTGRENTYLNGAILGMTKKEIDRKFDEIVEFAEVEQFIDTPVKHYSSGMYLRLAFSVAAHLEPEILMVDEVLAVGDTKFQKKCMGKIEEVAKVGRTVLFVSHNMAAVQALCSRGILLRNGNIISDTTAAHAVEQYLEDFSEVVSQPLWERRDRRGDGVVKLTEFWVENARGERTNKAIMGENVRLCFAYQAQSPLRNFQLGINLQETLGAAICSCFSSDVGPEFEVNEEQGVVVCEIKRFPLRAGRYVGDVYARVQYQTSDWVKGAFFLDVEEADFYGTGKLFLDAGYGTGRVLVSHDWEIRQTSDANLHRAMAS